MINPTQATTLTAARDSRILSDRIPVKSKWGNAGGQADALLLEVLVGCYESG